MSASFESFLARIYVDAEARERFLANPRAEAIDAGLTQLEAEALEGIDRAGLALAAVSFERKRARRSMRSRRWRGRIAAIFGLRLTAPVHRHR